MCVSEGEKRVVRVRARVSGKWWVVDVCVCEGGRAPKTSDGMI